jgi:hypothetical protein
MDLTRAISEPLAKLIDFHNAFNLNVKFAYGTLAQLNAPVYPNAAQRPVTLSNGGEPWSTSTRWRDLDEAVREAAVFIAEMGIARTASAFEDYLVGVKAELDRAAGRTHPAQKTIPEQRISESDDEPEDAPSASPPLRQLIARLGVDSTTITADVDMVNFFRTARNCVVHRSNRASKRLSDLRASPQLEVALRTWPHRRGKWTIDLPEVSQNQVVPWLPRHAIMASAVYYRCAVYLDRAAVSTLGRDGMVAMAAHWCLLADNLVPSPAKLDAQTMVRTQLAERYFVRGTALAEIVQALRNNGIWDRAQQEFAARGLIKASHVKRRAVRHIGR